MSSRTNIEVSTSALKNLLEKLKQARGTIESKKNSISHLAREHKRENLVIVVGAGISLDSGLLSWPSLLQKLLISSFQKELSQGVETSTILATLFNKIFQPTPLIAGRYLNNFYKKDGFGDPCDFLNAVRDALYEDFNSDNDSPIILEIRKLCLAVGKSPNLKGIISYNFDDLIERDLDKNGSEIRYRSIFTPGVHPQNDELPIYHVHGFLPGAEKLTDENKIVFSEDFYHNQYVNVYDWSNLIQIDMFSKSCCLLVGTSLTDPNQRRLLDIAKTIRGDGKIYHYCIRKKYSEDVIGKSLTQVLEENQTITHKKEMAGMDLKQTVKNLIRVMEIYEEKDAASFGVGTIWVEEYADVAKVLKDVRLGVRDIEE